MQLGSGHTTSVATHGAAERERKRLPQAPLRYGIFLKRSRACSMAIVRHVIAMHFPSKLHLLQLYLMNCFVTILPVRESTRQRKLVVR